MKKKLFEKYTDFFLLPNKKENSFNFYKTDLYSKKFVLREYASSIKTNATTLSFVVNSKFGEKNSSFLFFKKKVSLNSINLKREEYKLETFKRSNQDTCLTHKPVVREGSWVQTGDLLTDCASSVGGELSLGQNILVAYMPWEGYNFEDAILISERLVMDDLYTSVHIERYEFETQKNKTGKEEITRDIPDVSDRELEKLDLCGIVKLGSWVEEGDILIGKIMPINTKKISPYQKLLYTILEKEVCPVKDCSLRAPKGIKAKVIDIKYFLKNSNLLSLAFAKQMRLRSKSQSQTKTSAHPSSESLSQGELFRGLSLDSGLSKIEQNINLFSKEFLLKQIQRFTQKSTEKSTVFLKEKTKKKDNINLAFAKKHASGSLVNNKKVEKKMDKLEKGFLKKINMLFFSIQFRSALSRSESDVAFHDVKAQQNHYFRFSKANNRFAKTKTEQNRFASKSEQAKKSDFDFAFQTESRAVLNKIKKIEKRPNSHSNIRFKLFSSKFYSNFLNKEHPLNIQTLEDKTKNSNKQTTNLDFIGFTNQKVVPFLIKRSSSGVTNNKKPRRKLEFAILATEGLKTANEKFLKKNAILKDIETIQIYLAEKRKIQVGDKMAGRHGNKGIVSKILPIQDMPYLPNGTPIDMVLNPLGVPSRMNVGQIYECLLGLAGRFLGENYKIPSFDEIYGPEASRSFVFNKLYEARTKTGLKWLFDPNTPGKIRLFDGRNGNCFDQKVTAGQAYMLRLVHMVDDKIHMRSTGPYSLITQQPLRGRSKQGGQRLGEMEVWALEGYGAAFTLLEMLTIKSDDLTGRMTLWSNLILNKEILIGTPESFKVLICELQALCLEIGLFRKIENNDPTRRTPLREVTNLINLP